VVNSLVYNVGSWANHDFGPKGFWDKHEIARGAVLTPDPDKLEGDVWYLHRKDCRGCRADVMMRAGGWEWDDEEIPLPAV